MGEMEHFILGNFGRLIGSTSALVLPFIEFVENEIIPRVRIVMPYYLAIGSLFILWIIWHHRELNASRKNLDNSHFGPMENAFIKVETKRRKERSEQKLKTIEEKKED